MSRSKAALEIPIDRIERDPGQPREEFDPESLGRLAESIKARGLLQPVRVRWSEERGRYVLIAGERRWRAAGMAGLPTLTCIVTDGEMTPAELLAVQVTENLLREDLAPLERARAFRTLLDLNGWTGVQLAKELGISPASVTQSLALLDLPAPVQGQVDGGHLAPTVAYHVSKLDDPAVQQEVAGRIVAEGLSRAEAIEAVRQVSGARGGRPGKSKSRGARPSPRKVTARTFRAGGFKVTVENRRGIEDGPLADALAGIVAQLRGEQRQEPGEGRGEVAA